MYNHTPQKQWNAKGKPNPPVQRDGKLKLVAGAGIGPASGAYGAPRKTIPIPPAYGRRERDVHQLYLAWKKIVKEEKSW